MSLPRATKSPVNWTLFFMLLVASVAVTLTLLPYTLALVPPPPGGKLRSVTPILLVAQTVQAFIEFSAAIFFCLYLAQRVGFSVPVLEGAIEGRKPWGLLRSISGLSAGMGNGSIGVIFGWLYWKKGLESAMIAHFSSDVVLHVITPLMASLFI